MSVAFAHPLAEAFRAHERVLWGLGYRMTGSAADADDLVQETFARALAHPPRDTGRAWRPWLVRVAMNLARDHLRKRRRREYPGPWLPTPVPTEELVDVEPSAGARYEHLESVSFAFLVALEELTPQRRAVLILRDVLDYSVAETAEALGVSAASVKTALFRARADMRAYDRERVAGDTPHAEKTRAALGKLLACLAAKDVRGLEDLLAEDARAFSDGGGQYASAREPLVGRARVLGFYLRLVELRGLPAVTRACDLNGAPAMYFEMAASKPREAPRFTLHVEVTAAGKIARIFTVLAAAKLARVTSSLG